MVDIVIPLGNGSKSENDELRILLRSIEKHGSGYRHIIVVSDYAPDWLTNVKVIPCGDPLQKNKDGNLITKVLKAITETDITPDFVWSADDCALLQPLNFEILPPICNGRNKNSFPADGTIWQRRVRRTFEFLSERGIPMNHNFESHTPQRFPSRKLIRAMRNVDYQSDIGYAIDTLFFGLLGIMDGFDQKLFKETCESESGWKLNKMFIGYNDTAFLNGLRERLFELLPHKSRFERF